MADRTVLQVDHAEPEDKKLSGNVRQRGYDADMGGADALPTRGIHQVFKRHKTDPYGNHEQAAGEMLMSDFDLMELLKMDRKALEKPSDWNKSQHSMLFGEFLQ